jgi:hypothetical protein
MSLSKMEKQARRVPSDPVEYYLPWRSLVHTITSWDVAFSVPGILLKCLLLGFILDPTNQTLWDQIPRIIFLASLKFEKMHDTLPLYLGVSIASLTFWANHYNSGSYFTHYVTSQLNSFGHNIHFGRAISSSCNWLQCFRCGVTVSGIVRA